MVPRANRPVMVGSDKLRRRSLASPPKRVPRRKVENQRMREPSPLLVRELGGRASEMLEALEALVVVESPSSSPEACAACADVVDELGERSLGARAERHVVDGRTHLRWRFGAPRILLIGHLDTVWPLGTLARWPFAHVNELATGPGVLDMKAGVIQLLFASVGARRSRWRRRPPYDRRGDRLADVRRAHRRDRDRPRCRPRPGTERPWRTQDRAKGGIRVPRHRHGPSGARGSGARIRGERGSRARAPAPGGRGLRAAG